MPLPLRIELAKALIRRKHTLTNSIHLARIIHWEAHQQELIDNSVTPTEVAAAGLLHQLFHEIVQRFIATLSPETHHNLTQLIKDLFSQTAIQRNIEKTGGRYVFTVPWGGSFPEIESNLFMGIEYFLLSLLKNNPAAVPFQKLWGFDFLPFTDTITQIGTAFSQAIQKSTGKTAIGLDLLTLLKQPQKNAPGSFLAQLDYVKQLWPEYFPFLKNTLAIFEDQLAEEHLRVPGPGPVSLPTLPKNEEVNYSPETDWMSSLVLVAKNVRVWLYQLSSRFKRPVNRLDEIPDEALEELVEYGFTGLWLIGLWERSLASVKIKELTGISRGEASAYAVKAYRVSHDLGGEAALEKLKKKAFQLGIRLGADLVPNHTAMDAEWVRDHAEYYMQTPAPPFPNYTFSGPDLSPYPEIGLFLENHYYDRSDAAVVFKRIDYRTGKVSYIYHGNDGTSTPWNDTAQLDFLNPSTREAIKNTIVHLARRFPILRFDAAMTLVKRHIQRLWYPPPGQGGAVPGRAGFNYDPSWFHQKMPREFWQEVVEEVQQQAPDTLLLAEAFWLLEGYFIRTLGMHRVYNSAFMHMLRE